MRRYFIAFAAVLILIFVLTFLLFHGGSGKRPLTPLSLASYASTDAQVQMTVDGPINADQNHRSVHVTIDNNQVTFQALQGYQGTVINSQTYANNENAYLNFLLAMTGAGFTKGTPSINGSERGYCPLGDRIVFQFTQDGQDLERYWATSCGNPKTYLGNLNLTLTLIELQVPHYSTLVQNLSL